MTTKELQALSDIELVNAMEFTSKADFCLTSAALMKHQRTSGELYEEAGNRRDLLNRIREELFRRLRGESLPKD